MGRCEGFLGASRRKSFCGNGVTEGSPLAGAPARRRLPRLRYGVKEATGSKASGRMRGRGRTVDSRAGLYTRRKGSAREKDERSLAPNSADSIPCSEGAYYTSPGRGPHLCPQLGGIRFRPVRGGGRIGVGRAS